MSVKQQQRTMGVVESVECQSNARIQEAVLCLATGNLTRGDLRLLEGDAHILTSPEEATDFASDYYSCVVVFPCGLGLARDLLQINALDSSRRIHWQLGKGLLESLDILAQLDLGPNVHAVGINHVEGGTVVTTALATGSLLDADSYRSGVQAGSAGNSSDGGMEGPAGSMTVHDSDRQITEKLLSMLQTVEPLSSDAPPACERAHDESAEHELALLKRDYRALERKYCSLAASRLGKLTLRLWARRRSTPSDVSMTGQ